MMRTWFLVAGGWLALVGCGEELLEDRGETCSSGVSWSGVELETREVELRVRACVEDFCVRRPLAIVDGDTCGARIEAQGDVPSSGCAFRQERTTRLILHLDLTSVAEQLKQRDEGFLEVTSANGDLLFRHAGPLTYVGSTDGAKPCRNAQVDVRGIDSSDADAQEGDARGDDLNKRDSGGSVASRTSRGSDGGF